MSPKVKNIVIIAVVVVALVLGYIFFMQKSPDQANLVSSLPSGTPASSSNTSGSASTAMSGDLLSVLLGVKSIKLDDSIFSNKAFLYLRDSSITITTPTDAGRANPFAPIGSDGVAPVPPSLVPVNAFGAPTTGDTTAPINTNTGANTAGTGQKSTTPNSTQKKTP